MRKVFRRAHSVASLLLALGAIAFSGTEALAQSTTIQNISGFNLPGVTLPQGSDEVRAADGTTCRSAISGDGAYLDVGFIGNPEQTNNSASGSFSAYTRVVIPLGEKRSRIDCSRLYDLEVRRLEIELRLVELGLNRGIAPVSETETRAFSSDDSGDADAVASGEAKDDAPVQVAEAKQSSGSAWDDDGWTTDGLEEKQKTN